jgi:D12 class N6 adenine-specific DNA methyltransferase
MGYIELYNTFLIIRRTNKKEKNMIDTPSPLRYPGGKTILYKKIKNILEKNNLIECTYMEPFSGGAGLALKLLMNNDVKRIVINDLDFAIYSFWHNVLYDTDKFCNDIENIKVNLDEWEKQKYIYNNQDNYSMYEIGLATFFLNRTNRSGIIKGGAIGGKKQEGKYKIDCRFNKKVLIQKIKEIEKYKDRIKLFNYDANDFIKIVVMRQKNNNYFIYFDPPYIKKGPELYKNHFNLKEHTYLSEGIKEKLSEKNWIVTYDENKLVYSLYENFQIINFDLKYSAGQNKIGNEVMIMSKKLKI